MASSEKATLSLGALLREAASPLFSYREQRSGRVLSELGQSKNGIRTVGTRQLDVFDSMRCAATGRPFAQDYATAKTQILSQMLPGSRCCTSMVEPCPSSSPFCAIHASA